MAERRMFAKTIIDSDAFLDMPVSARLLYYDLAMRADDDGFVNSPKKIMKFVGASNDDLNILLLRKFIIGFPEGIVVIKHWRIHNYIRKDTYTETSYKEEKAMLELDENKAYRLAESTPRQLPVDEPSTQDRLGKVSIELGKDNIPPKNESSSAKVTQKADAFAYLVEGYDDEIRSLLLDWLAVRKAKRAAATEKAIMLNLNKLEKMAKESNLTVTEYLEEVIRRGWAAFYPISSFEKSKDKPKEEAKPSYNLDKFEEKSLHGELKYDRKRK